MNSYDNVLESKSQGMGLYVVNVDYVSIERSGGISYIQNTLNWLTDRFTFHWKRLIGVHVSTCSYLGIVGRSKQLFQRKIPKTQLLSCHLVRTLKPGLLGANMRDFSCDLLTSSDAETGVL